MDVVVTNERMAAYLRDNYDKVAGRWADLVVAEVRGRTSREEVRRSTRWPMRIPTWYSQT